MPADTPKALPPQITQRFEGAETWQAVRSAEAWCEERGVSVGRMDRYDIRGLLLGDFDIAKWHNLTQRERCACHGQMTGEMREGPVTVTLTDPAAIAAVLEYDRKLEKADV
jgi:hypothetical protein